MEDGLIESLEDSKHLKQKKGVEDEVRKSSFSDNSGAAVGSGEL
jgi:hypothetical protein